LLVVVVVILLDPLCLNAEYKGRDGMTEPLYLQQLRMVHSLSPPVFGQPISRLGRLIRTRGPEWRLAAALHQISSYYVSIPTCPGGVMAP